MTPNRALIALLVAGTLLSGCGTDRVEVEGRTLQIRLDEYRLMPQDVRVTAGRLRVVATNVGRLPHNLRIVKEDEEDRESLPTDIAGTRTAQPGESASITIEDLEPGTYRLACTISNHDSLGQYGSLEAVAP